MTELNTTVSLLTSGMTSGASWVSMIVIVGILVVVLVLFMLALASFEQYARTKKWLRWILNTLKYFCFGILTLIVIALPACVIYYFLSQAKKGNIVPLKITLYLIGGYITICIIGWIGKRLVYDRIKKFEKKGKGDKKKKKGKKNLWEQNGPLYL